MINKSKNLEVVLTLCFVIIVDSIGVSLIYPVLAPLFSVKTGGILPFAITLHTRDILYGAAMAIFPIFMFMGAPVIGDLSDHFGRKKVLLICLLGEAAGMLVTGLVMFISAFKIKEVRNLSIVFFHVGSLGACSDCVCNRKTEELIFISQRAEF